MSILFQHAIVTKYIPCTANKGSRIKAQSVLGALVTPWEGILDVPANHNNAAYHLAIKQLGQDMLGYELVTACLPDGKTYCHIFVKKLDK